MKFLSIVIPTYNRALLLKETLDGLSRQILSERFDNIEIVVSDNASSDSTSEVVSIWMKANKQVAISYNRNIENLGFDRNCLLGASKAKGRFVWFMSDDDSLAEGAVEKVFKALKEHLDVMFAFVNYSIESPGQDDVYPCRFSENLEVSANELLLKTNFSFSFISACIFNRNTLCSLDLTDYLDSFWMQLYAVKEAAIQGKSLIIAEPLIRKCESEGYLELCKKRRDPPQKIDIFMDFHLSYLDFLGSFENSAYSRKTIESVWNTGWNENLAHIVSLRSSADDYNFDEIKIVYLRMKKHFQHKVLFWLLHVPVLFLPTQLTSRCYFFVKAMKIKWRPVLKPVLIKLRILHD